MKKAFLFKITLLFGTMFSGILLLLLLFVVCMDGGAESSLYIPADDETAAAYQAICSETGVPWDIALMADVLLAEQLGQRIEEREPLITSLQFCILTVTEQEAYEEEITENGQKYQVPTKYTYLTSGSGRVLTLGNRTIELKRSVPKNFAFQTVLAALLVQALRTLGQKNVGNQELSTIRKLQC